MRPHSLAGFFSPLIGALAALALPDDASAVLTVLVFVGVSMAALVAWQVVFR